MLTATDRSAIALAKLAKIRQGTTPAAEAEAAEFARPDEGTTEAIRRQMQQRYSANARRPAIEADPTPEAEAEFTEGTESTTDRLRRQMQAQYNRARRPAEFSDVRFNLDPTVTEYNLL